MRKIFTTALIILLFPCLLAADHNPQIRVRRKIATDVDRIKVIEVQTVGQNFHYEVNRDALSERLNEDFIEKVSEKTKDKVIDELLAIIEEVLAQLGKGEIPTIPQPEPTPDKPEEDPFDNLPGDNTSLDDKVTQIFFSNKYKCFACHNETKKNKGIQLVQGKSLANIDSLTKFRTARATETGHMPPELEKLTDEEVELLKVWAEAEFK